MVPFELAGAHLNCRFEKQNFRTQLSSGVLESSWAKALGKSFFILRLKPEAIHCNL